MCGRTSCSLRPERYECASSYYDPKCEEYKKPEFQQPENIKFKPSTNVAPTEVAPVLIWNVNGVPVMKPMVWGMIPPWTEDIKSKKYSTHNCRIEDVKKSNLYRTSLNNNKRCVAVCEGYYEWSTVGTLTTRGTNPTFIYAKQPNGMRAEEINDWDNGTWSAREGWTGPSLTYMAGLYSVWHSPENEVVLSYSVVTMDSAPCLQWLHHRMPAILSTPEEINDWLNYDIDSSDALEKLKQSENLSWHTVSKDVNNSRNKDSQLNKPITERTKGKQTILTSWLTKSEKRNAGDSADNSDPHKKSKLF